MPRWLMAGIASSIAALLIIAATAGCQTASGCTTYKTNFNLRVVAYDAPTHAVWVAAVQNQRFCASDGLIDTAVQTLQVNLDDLKYQAHTKQQTGGELPATPAGYKDLYYGSFTPLSCLACDFTVRVGTDHSVHCYADSDSVLHLDIDAGATPALQFRIDGAALTPVQGTP